VPVAASAASTAASSCADHWRKIRWCGWRPRHEVLDGEPVGRDRRLRQQAEPLRDLLRRQRPDRAAVEQHGAGARRQQATERPQQRRLAAAVGADHGGHGPALDREVELVHDRVLAVRQRDVLGAQAHAALRSR
jgi:hypothetical protein